MSSRRSAIAQWIDVATRAAGLHRILSRRRAAALTVLMYHRVLPDGIAGQYPLSNLVIRESNFVRQLRWLAEHTTVMTLGAALSVRCRAGRPRRPIVALTFDDGYLDNSDVAARCLEGCGQRATFFVTTGFVEGRPLWFDVAAVACERLGASACARIAGSNADARDLGELLGIMKGLPDRRRRDAVEQLEQASGPMPGGMLFAPMSPEDVAALAAAGHEVGSHTESHPILPRADRSTVATELRGSRRKIAEWTGAPPAGFCYPNGSVDKGIRAEVSAAGYGYACTTRPGVNPWRADPYLLARTMIAPESTSTPGGAHSDAMFSAEVLGVHAGLRAVASAFSGSVRGGDRSAEY